METQSIKKKLAVQWNSAKEQLFLCANKDLPLTWLEKTLLSAYQVYQRCVNNFTVHWISFAKVGITTRVSYFGKGPYLFQILNGINLIFYTIQYTLLHSIGKCVFFQSFFICFWRPGKGLSKIPQLFRLWKQTLYELSVKQWVRWEAQNHCSVNNMQCYNEKVYTYVHMYSIVSRIGQVNWLLQWHWNFTRKFWATCNNKASCRLTAVERFNSHLYP